MDKLLPEDQFQLYAVATRVPRKLAKQVPLSEVQPGVFHVQWGARLIRVLVLNTMPKTNENAIWQLFSSTTEGISYGQQQYRWNIPNISNIIKVLYKGIKMTYTVEDFKRDLPKEILAMMSAEYRAALIEELSPDEMIKHLSPDEMIKHLSPDEMARHLSPDEMIKHLSPDEMAKHLSPDEMIKHLSPDEMAKHLSPDEMIKHLSPDEMVKHISPEQRKKMLDLLSKAEK